MPDHVVYREFVQETVILNLETGTYHGLNPTGGKMLETLGAAGDRGGSGCDSGRPLPAAATRRSRTISTEFCLDLHERGLVELTHD